MRDLINQIVALYGKLTLTSVIALISLVSAWLYRRRRKREGRSIMASIVGGSIAFCIIGMAVGSTIFAEIVHRWKKGQWSGEYMARLKEAVDQMNKAGQENRRLKPKKSEP
jgi:hypothetical protein